jgi:hypothetical protein
MPSGYVAGKSLSLADNGIAKTHRQNQHAPIGDSRQLPRSGGGLERGCPARLCV